MKALFLVALLFAASLTVLPMAGAAPPEPQCMQVYQRSDVGTISIVRRDTCHAEIYECPYQGAPISECRYLLE